MTKKNLISKYPYLGYSPNIIEYFGIIGYQEEFLPEIIKDTPKENNIYPPTILNSVISNIDYGTTDNNLMLTQIYPDNPPIFKYNNYEGIPPPSSVIYSFCFDSTDGKSKLFYTCYAYKFHEIYKNPLNNNDIYCIPKAFAIISQYAFFNTFHYICQNLEKIISSKNKVTLPMEILIYSLLNYLPAPMNYKINLSVFDFLIKTEKIKLEQLSGYPYIDFDLGDMFNLLPVNLVLEIYLITFLEQKILFFSENLEILNLIMYIMFSLNYPCNDSIYFWHIVSLAPKNFNDDNKFVGKLQNSLLGVNSAYDEEIETSLFGSYYFIMDLDNKKLFLKYDKNSLSPEEKNEVNDLKNLQDYIQNCIKDKYVESFFLKKFILELKNNIENILYKEQYYYGNDVDFFKISPKIKENNKKFQELFYIFNLNILMMFYNDNELNTSYDKITNIENKMIKELKIKGRTISLSHNEILFCGFFREAIKYKVYYENFIQNFDSIDIFKISLLFCEEFINLKLNDYENNVLSNISFFKIIDTLYFQSMPQTVNISINNLFNEYTEKIAKNFRHFFSSQKKTEKQLFVLNRKILNKFIYLLSNKYENKQLLELFPSLSLRTSDFIAPIDQRSVKDVIKNYLINENILKNSDCILFSVVYIFVISLTLHPFQQTLMFLGEILYCLNKLSFFIRYYINIILQTFYNYFLINIKTKEYPEMSFDNMKIYFFFIGNYLKQKGIVPDEEMMSVLSSFFGNKIIEERDKRIVKFKDVKNLDQNTIKEEKDEKNENKNNNNDNKNDILSQKNEAKFQIKFKYNFFCFVKHAFSNNSVLKPKFLIKCALNTKGYSNMVVTCKDIKMNPKVVVKILDYVNTSDLFFPDKIYHDCSFLYSDFSENFNFDIKKINIQTFRSLITNLILYGLEMTDVQIPFDFLIYTLYAIKDFETKE